MTKKNTSLIAEKSFELVFRNIDIGRKKDIGKIGARCQLNPPAATTSAVSVDELFFALKNRAKKSIRTVPRGQFIPNSPARGAVVERCAFSHFWAYVGLMLETSALALRYVNRVGQRSPPC